MPCLFNYVYIWNNRQWYETIVGKVATMLLLFLWFDMLPVQYLHGIFLYVNNLCKSFVSVYIDDVH